MEKFSYGVEFYKRGLFSLDNIPLFKRKVKDADEVEKYFAKVLPNVQYVRKYILRSYVLNKKYEKLNRIRYVKGLIYAANYIDFNDIQDFSEYIDEVLYPDIKSSLFEYTNFDNNEDNPSLFEQDLEYKVHSSVLSTIPSIQQEYEYELYIGNTDNEEYSEDDDENEDVSDEELDDSYIEIQKFDVIHPKNKIELFKKYKKKYINDIINIKEIKKEDVKIVRKGMNDWINFAITSLEDIYNLKEYTLRYTDENISKYL